MALDCKKFFDELDTELPSSEPAERFKEELADHIADATNNLSGNESSTRIADEDILRSIGKPQNLAHIYIKKVHFELLISAYLQALVVGFISGILYVSYFFLLRSRFFQEHIGFDDSWQYWAITGIFPFFIFTVFYLITTTSLLQKIDRTSRRYSLGIIAALPCFALLSWLTISQEAFVSTQMAGVLFVGYAALAGAVYIIKRLPKRSVPNINKWQKAYCFGQQFVVALIFLYVVVSSMLFNLPAIRQTPLVQGLLEPREKFEEILRTSWGIGTIGEYSLTTQAWIYGILLIIVGLLCGVALANYGAHYFTKKRIPFPIGYLTLLTYIISILWFAPRPPATSDIAWKQPTTDIAVAIERKEMGPLYRWFTAWFKYHSYFPALGYLSTGTTDGFLVSQNGPDTARLFSLNNLRSETDFKITELDYPYDTEPLIGWDKNARILPNGFRCASSPLTLHDIDPAYQISDNSVLICSALRYKDRTILITKKPYVIFGVNVDSANQWAIINLGEADRMGRAYMYLFPLGNE